MKSATVAPETDYADVRQFDKKEKGDKSQKGKIVIPRPEDFKSTRMFFDDMEVWERYEAAYCAFISYGVYPSLKRPLTENDIGKNIQNTVVDYSTAYALQGSDYIDEMQMNLQYTVLQSALVLTISMPLYIDPPDFSREFHLRIFSAVIGLAAFMQLITIIGCTIVSALFNRAYTGSDAMVARVKAGPTIINVNIWNYLANFATIAAMLIAGFSRSTLDGAVHLYVGLLAMILIAMFIGSMSEGNRLQDVRSYQFYAQYCDPNTGRLKEEYLKRIYAKRKQSLDKALERVEKMDFVNENS